MPSFLSGSLRKQLAQGFRGHLLTGTLTRETATGLDSYGDPTTTSATYRVQGFHDAYDESYRVRAGIPETDSKIVLVLGNGQIDPIKDDEITLSGYKTFKVRRVKVDPAKATAECQVFEIF
jgi:hypothetical protein